MRALVVYESVYGNTHLIADAIAEGLGRSVAVETVAVDDATSSKVAEADLLVVGGPTHAHGMSSTGSREQTVLDERARAEKADPKKPAHELDEAATGEGLRTWFHELGDTSGGQAVAFDTRFDKPRFITGSAAKGIDRRLRHHGFTPFDDPTSFFVEHSDGPLAAGEAVRAREWGEVLGRRLTSESTRIP